MVSDDPSAIPTPPPPSEDAEARITLRLPEYLKELITEAADVSGDSVNAYVVDALKSVARTKKSARGGRRHIEVEL